MDIVLLLRLFKDEGISGAKVDEETLEVDRIGFQEMLEYLAHHEVDYVVTLNTSRLWRSDIVKVLVHRELKKYGVDIRSIEQLQYSIHKKDLSDFLINGLMELFTIQYKMIGRIDGLEREDLIITKRKLPQYFSLQARANPMQ